MSDLVKRLREADDYNRNHYERDPLHLEAAARIEQLEVQAGPTLRALAAENAALRAEVAQLRDAKDVDRARWEACERLARSLAEEIDGLAALTTPSRPDTPR